ELAIRKCRIRPQKYARISVIFHESVDVPVLTPELGQRSRLRLRERKIPGTRLHTFRRPVIREVAVQVQSMTRPGKLNFVAVKVVDDPFADQAVILAAELVRLALDHHALVLLRY